jgi:hydrogenase maturation protease
VCEHDGEPAGLLERWDGARIAVVVDAVRTGAPPGTVHRVAVGDAAQAAAASSSSHGLGLGDAVELARALGRMPPALVIYGIEPGDAGAGRGLSGPVADAADRVAGEILRLLDREAARCA